MATIGKMVGVSQVTVSRALSDPSKVSKSTLRLINEAIEATGFVPNRIAGALASQRSGLITALVPSITNIVYANLLHAFSNVMREQGYQIMVSETGFALIDEEKLIATHLSRRPDGVLLTGVHHTDMSRRMLLNAYIPVVEFWDITETPIDCCVGFSHYEAGVMVAEFAVAAGYKAGATMTTADQRTGRRRDGFATRFAQLTGTPVVQIDYPPGPATIGLGREVLRQLVDVHGFRNGLVFASSDMFAHGLLVEASHRGLRVPEEIAVVGFGNQDFSADIEPSLTSVHIDRLELGRTAAQALLTRLNGDSDLERVIALDYKIVRRKSA